MDVMKKATADRTALVGAGLLGVIFVGTAVLASVAPGRSPIRAAESAGDGGWPACGSVRGRSSGCWNGSSAPVASVPTSETTSARPPSRACSVTDLEVRIEGSQGLGGTNYTPLVFKNRSFSACTLSGHPHVTFLDRSGRAIGQTAPTPLIEPPVTPAPGEVAVADLMVGSQSLGECRPVNPATIRVSVGDGGAITIAAGTFRFCPGEITGIDQYNCPQLGCDRDHT